ncbi:hypothetical protein Tco_0041814, partial [Tanacetum coccineum]
MPPKRTSTSETPAITLAAIQQLINDGISSALKAQDASMASDSNPNRNTGPTGTPLALKAQDASMESDSNPYISFSFFNPFNAYRDFITNTLLGLF